MDSNSTIRGRRRRRWRFQTMRWRTIVGFLVGSSTLLCFLFLVNSNVPDTTLQTAEEESVQLGALGEATISMLPDDLPFTIFVPTEEAFRRTLGLGAEDERQQPKKIDDAGSTFAILSRVMGFAAVPRRLTSGQVGATDVVALDSVSGYALRVWKASDGSLVANGVRSKQVDLSRGEIVVHLMDGVIMDPEFASSFSSSEQHQQHHQQQHQQRQQQHQQRRRLV